MILAIPIFENGKCYLRLSTTSTEGVVLRSIVIRREPFFEEAAPQILEPNIQVNPGQQIDYDVTNALIRHVAVNTLEERANNLHFDLGYTPRDDDQPEEVYRVVSRGKSIVSFDSY